MEQSLKACKFQTDRHTRAQRLPAPEHSTAQSLSAAHRSSDWLAYHRRIVKGPLGRSFPRRVKQSCLIRQHAAPPLFQAAIGASGASEWAGLGHRSAVPSVGRLRRTKTVPSVSRLRSLRTKTTQGVPQPLLGRVAASPPAGSTKQSGLASRPPPSIGLCLGLIDGGVGADR